MSQNTKNQMGIDGNRFSFIRPSTAKARQAKLGLGRKIGEKKRSTRKTKSGSRSNFSVPLTRLLFTGDFYKNAFKSKAQLDSVTVFLSGMNHRDPGTAQQISYADIVKYNNKGSDELNTDIHDPPLVWPNNIQEVKQMKAYANMEKLVRTKAFKDDVTNQIVGEVKNTVIRIVI